MKLRKSAIVLLLLIAMSFSACDQSSLNLPISTPAVNEAVPVPNLDNRVFIGEYSNDDGRAPVEFTIFFRQNQNDISGSFNDGSSGGDTFSGSIDNDKISFTIAYNEYRIQYSGTFRQSTNEIRGTWTFTNKNGTKTGTFVIFLNTDPATEAALAGKPWEYIFGQNVKTYQNSAEAQSNMAWISVRVWVLDTETGNKTPGRKTLQVNKKLTIAVKLIFEEIYNNPEKFPIKDLGWYNFRYIEDTDILSQHSYGTCIDVNSDENAYYVKGILKVGKLWEPGKNQFSMPADCSVVEIFKKYGWTWGGDWTEPKDYMHFSYLGEGKTVQPAITPAATPVPTAPPPSPSPSPAVETEIVNGHGNTNGNIVNGGFISRCGDWIYYCNIHDGYKLYKMKEDGSGRTKICDDKVKYINVLGDWIYYQNGSDKNRLYKIRTDGSGRVKICDDNVHYVNVLDDTIYYINTSDKGELDGTYIQGAEYYGKPYKIRIDGTGRAKISDDNACYLNIQDGYIYYSNYDDGLAPYRIMTDGSSRFKICDDNAYSLNVSGDQIYYLCWEGLVFSSKRIYKIKTDGTERTLLGGEGDIKTRGYTSLNVDGEWIYCNNDMDIPNKLIKIKTDGSGLEIFDEYCCYNINTTDTYIYFNGDFLNNKAFMIGKDWSNLTSIE